MSEDSSNLVARSTARSLPGWFVALVVLLSAVFIFFFAEFAGSLILSVYAVLHHWTGVQADVWLTSSVGAQFVYGVIADSFLVLGVYLMLRWLWWNWRTIGFLRPKVVHIIIGALSVVPYFLLYLLIVAVVKYFVPSLDIEQKQEIGFNSVSGVVPLLLAFVSLVILPPLAEETLMRGYLFTGLKKWLPWTVAGLFVSTLFGAAHLAEGGAAGPLWIGAIDTFTLSLVLVFLRQTTGNLWAGIILHGLKNGVAFAILFIIGGR